MRTHMPGRSETARAPARRATGARSMRRIRIYACPGPRIRIIIRILWQRLGDQQPAPRPKSYTCGRARVKAGCSRALCPTSPKLCPKVVLLR